MKPTPNVYFGGPVDLNMGIILHPLDYSTKKTIKISNKIGVTSGFFDIMHVGHINTLKLCKKNCDTFFVCLSSDKQIEELKGETRPINTINDRIRMLTTMPFIDYIILYDEINNQMQNELDTIINILNPHVWFKGSDYNEKEILKLHPSLKNIMLFENLKDKGTTNLVNKIQQGI